MTSHSNGLLSNASQHSNYHLISYHQASSQRSSDDVINGIDVLVLLLVCLVLLVLTVIICVLVYLHVSEQSLCVCAGTSDSCKDASAQQEERKVPVPVMRSLSEGLMQTLQQHAHEHKPSLERQLSCDIEDISDLDIARDLGDDDCSQGRLWFSVVYDVSVEQLSVRVVKAKISSKQVMSWSWGDCFVKLYLLPDDTQSQETRHLASTLEPSHLASTLEPTFNETLTVSVSRDTIYFKTLRLSVYDVDRRRVRHTLGHVILPLMHCNLDSGAILCRNLVLDVTLPNTALGDILLTLSYDLDLEQLKVNVTAGRYNFRHHTNTDHVVQVVLYHDQVIEHSAQTQHQSESKEPVYNESFVFTLVPCQIETCSLVVAVVLCLDNGQEEYGRVTFGPSNHAGTIDLLTELAENQLEHVTLWYALNS